MSKRKRIKPEDIIVAIESKRIAPTDREPGLHYYEMRHGESDWAVPIGVEKFVFVNFLGTLVTNTPLELTDDLLVPTWKEKRIICEKMQDKKFVIFSQYETDENHGHLMYWSKMHGWCPLDHATVYDSTSHPLPTGQGIEWVEIGAASLKQVIKDQEAVYP